MSNDDARLRVAQKVFIRNKNGEVLLVRFSSNGSVPKHLFGKWDIPGGGMKPNETLQQAIDREIREEVGEVVVHIGKPVTVWEFHDSLHNGCIVIGYDAAYVSGEVVLNEEHDMFEWVSLEHLLDYPFDPAELSAMKQYIKNIV